MDLLGGMPSSRSHQCTSQGTHGTGKQNLVFVCEENGMFTNIFTFEKHSNWKMLFQ